MENFAQGAEERGQGRNILISKLRTFTLLVTEIFYNQKSSCSEIFYNQKYSCLEIFYNQKSSGPPASCSRPFEPARLRPSCPSDFRLKLQFLRCSEYIFWEENITCHHPNFSKLPKSKPNSYQHSFKPREKHALACLVRFSPHLLPRARSGLRNLTQKSWSTGSLMIALFVSEISPSGFFVAGARTRNCAFK